MQKFYSDYNQVKVRQIKAILDDAGIPCFMKNEFIQGASGEVPPHETLPEIWLRDNSWEAKAQRLVDELEKELAEYADIEWTCEGCEEQNEGQFMICWQCQHDRPSDALLKGSI
jgi:cytochrome c556